MTHLNIFRYYGGTHGLMSVRSLSMYIRVNGHHYY